MSLTHILLPLLRVAGLCFVKAQEQAASQVAVQAMADLLRRHQKSPPCEDIVRLASEPSRHKPLQVHCPCCKQSRNFDHLFGSFTRLELNEASNRGSKYLAAPSIKDFMDRVVPQAVQALADSNNTTLPTLEWRCCNCESGLEFDKRRKANRQAEATCAATLGLSSTAAADVAVALGVPYELNISDIPLAPVGNRSLSRHEHAVLFGSCPVRAGVVMVRKEAVAPAIAADDATLTALMGAPSMQGLFAEAVGLGDAESTREAAGGAESVNQVARELVRHRGRA